MQWPPDFEAENERRELVQKIISSTPDPRDTANDMYADDCVQFILDNCVTFDPRNPAKKLPAKMPFILFPRQEELVKFIVGLQEDESDGLIEKSRDMGATWVCAAISVWLWLYHPGSSVGWGSRKEQLVDKIGDPDSIFQKIRMIITSLPWYCKPEGMVEKVHLTFMKCIHPSNDSTITGEGGDNIGRGGRSSIYFKDEAAHYERAELIEAALGDNTNVQVDISSVNGEGNVFHRRSQSPYVKKFIMDWRDHPAKTQEWYDARKEKAEAEGLEHVFAQEVDRDYAAAVEGIMIPAKWARATLDAHIKLGIEMSGARKAGLDVADEGGDQNALVCSYGGLVNHVEQWNRGDVGFSSKKAWNHCIDNHVEQLVYDSIGVGAGVKAKVSELEELPQYSHINIDILGFAASSTGGVIDPDHEFTEEKTNGDMFSGNKAQAWWTIRDMCHETYKAINGEDHDASKLLSISSDCEHAHELISELSRPLMEYSEQGKVRVESKAKMKKRGLSSPNLADALVMCFAPVDSNSLGALLEMANRR